jgi:type II secretory pathway pseudopilin PulG
MRAVERNERRRAALHGDGGDPTARRRAWPICLSLTQRPQASISPSTPAVLHGTRRRAGVAGRRCALSGPPGIVFLMLLAMILVISIVTTGVTEVWHTQMRREREAELIFRLNEIRQAITKYRADHNRPPRELKDLLRDTSQIQVKRYLRRLYTDPMTGKGEWELKLVIDRTGAVSGIDDVHSRSTAKPLKILPDKQADTYKDW